MFQKMLLSSFMSVLLCATLSEAQVSINWNDVHQRISGFGACAGGPINESQADFWFSPQSGLGLSLCRIEMCNNVGIRCDYAPSDEAHIAQLASARGAFVWAAPWSPPAAWKSNNDVSHGGNLLLSHYQDYANLMVQYIKDLKTNYGVDLGGISVQNEPDTWQPYPSCQWSPADIINFIANYMGPTFKSNGIATKIIAPERGGWSHFDEWVDPFLNDPTELSYLSILALHAYDPPLPPDPLPQVAQAGKELWETEMAFYQDGSISSGVFLAGVIHGFLCNAEVNAWHHWGMNQPDYGRGTLVEGDGSIRKQAYVIGNYSKFIRPGYYRVGVSPESPQSGVLVSAYKDGVSGKFIVVAINSNTNSVNLSFSNVPGSSVTPWETSAADNLAQKTDIAVSNHSFTATLDAQSIITFVGVGASLPPAKFASLAISPQNMSVGPGQTCRFSAKALDGNGMIMAISPAINWGVSSGGTINSTGLFTAGGTEGTSAITASATVDGITGNGTAEVVIRKDPPGINYAYYKGSWSALPDFGSLTPMKTATRNNFDIFVTTSSDNFAIRFDGYINIASTGTYTFATASDDGSKLYIDTSLVVDNDGGHQVVEVSGDVQLSAGWHAIRVDYFQALWAKSLVVKMNGTPIADNILSRWADVGNAIRQPSLAYVVRRGSVPVTLYDLRGKRIGEFANKAAAMHALQFRHWMGIAVAKSQNMGQGAETAARLIIR